MVAMKFMLFSYVVAVVDLNLEQVSKTGAELNSMQVRLMLVLFMLVKLSLNVFVQFFSSSGYSIDRDIANRRLLGNAFAGDHHFHHSR